MFINKSPFVWFHIVCSGIGECACILHFMPGRFHTSHVHLLSVLNLGLNALGLYELELFGKSCKFTCYKSQFFLDISHQVWKRHCKRGGYASPSRALNTRHWSSYDLKMETNIKGFFVTHFSFDVRGKSNYGNFYWY